MSHSHRATSKGHRPRRHGGFGLIELILVLGIASALAIASFILYKAVSQNNQVKDASYKYAEAVAATRTFYSDRPTDGVTSASMVSANLLDANALTSAWSQPIDILPAQDGATCTTSCQQFLIGFENVSSDLCSRLINVLEDQSQAIYIYGSYNNYVKSSTVVYNFSTAANACQTATSATIYFWPR